MQQTTKAHLALLGANLIYGIGFSVAKMVMPVLISPSAFILIRVVCATALFWCTWFLGASFRTTIDRGDWGRLILCALTGVVFNQLMFFKGLSLTSPIHASLLMLSTPILVTFIAAYMVKEKITKQKVLGLCLAVCGAIMLVYSRNNFSGATNSSLGDLFIFLNACSYAFYLVLVKPLMHKYRPIIVIRWIFLLACCIIIPFGFADFTVIPFATFEVQHWYAVIFIVMGVTFFTYLWNIYAIQHLSASIAGAYIYLQPIFAAIIAVLFFGENFSPIKILSSVLIFTGVWLSTRVIARFAK